jgi:hypothetical protein
MTIADINWRRHMMRSTGGPSAPDEARQATLDRMRREASKPRLPQDKVMIVDRTGMDHDIKTGRPPVMKREVREAWERAREEIGIDKLFR